MNTPRFVDDPVWRHRGNPRFPGHDELGFQNELELAEARYLLTGSSHVYGTNLARAETWPILLQRSGVPVYSAALGAWSAMQYALVAEEYAHPSIEQLIVCLYLGFDIYASLKQGREVGQLPSPIDTAVEKLGLGLDWRQRERRDAFLRQRRQEGATLADALAEARSAGMEDCVSVTIDDGEFWLEPRLREVTMDLSSRYIELAASVTEAYLERVRMLSERRSIKLSVYLFPTKEAVAFSRTVRYARPAEELRTVTARESELANRLLGFCASRGVSAAYLHGLYDRYPLSVMFDNTPLEGHPSQDGARIIGDYLRESFLGDSLRTK